MTGLEALNKIVNTFAEYCVISQHQYLNATNIQTAVEYLARSEECRTIEKSLKALEIIKEKSVDVFRIYYYVTSNKIIELEEYIRDRNLTKEEFNLLKEVLEC